MTLSITAHGPIFDHTADKILTDASREWASDLAELGNVMVRANLNTVLRTQTPVYRTKVEAVKVSADAWKVWDGGKIVYGPWLEGVGSRNYPVTRFKGYFTFRRTTQQLAAKAVQTGEPIVRTAVAKMGG